MVQHSRAFTGFVEDLGLFSQDQNGSFQLSATPVLELPSPPDLGGHMLHTHSHRYKHKTNNFIFLKKPLLYGLQFIVFYYVNVVLTHGSCIRRGSATVEALV